MPELATIYPRLKEVVWDSAPDTVEFPIASRDFLDDVGVFYISDQGSVYAYLSEPDLAEAGLTIDDIHRIAIENLSRLVTGRGEVHELDRGIKMLSGLDGLETSLVFLPAMLATYGFAAADSCLGLPVRDVLLFCSRSDVRVVERLRDGVQRLYNDARGSERVSRRLIVADASSTSGYAHFDLPLSAALSPTARPKKRGFWPLTRH